MNDLNSHYRLLLGLEDAWAVQNVDLDLDAGRVVIDLEHAGGSLCCPECEDFCTKFDNAPRRSWRHLDTMQFETVVCAVVPRSNCSKCGVKTISIPWAGKHSRFTLMFEAFAISVLQAASNITRAAELLRLSWGTVDTLMERAVSRGLARREDEPIEYIGIDEKSFGRARLHLTDGRHRPFTSP
jgi:transposase